MGIYDRDYYRDTMPRGGFGVFRALSVTTWLIVINIAVFFVDGVSRRATLHRPPPEIRRIPETPEEQRKLYREILMWRMSPLEKWGYFSTATAIASAQVWRFFTFQFLHASIGHLLGNMISLYLFGPIVEAHFGARRFTAFYLLCGLAGAASYLLLSAANVLVYDPDTPLVGASAGIFGLLVAAALIAPDVEIYICFFPVKVRVLAIFAMVMALYTVVAMGHNAGGEAAHLGGGILGFLLMRQQQWLNVFAPGARKLRAGRRGFQKDWSKDMNR